MKELPEVFARGERGGAERAEQEKKVQEVYAQIGRLSTELEWLRRRPAGVTLGRGPKPPHIGPKHSADMVRSAE